MIVLGLGGNLGTDTEILERFVHVARAFRDVRWAKLYRTAPIGPAQSPFLNTALAIADHDDILAAIGALEHRLGRVRDVRWGPRTLDIDVLVWDGRVLDDPALTVPHPRLGVRRFALQPLVDLVGADFVIPGLGRAGDALARVLDQDVTLLGELREVRAMGVDE